MKQFIHVLTLFTTSSTLLCCALPALLVTLGAGSVMASLVSTFPGLIWFSVYKVAIFVFAGIMLSIAGLLQWNTRFEPCPIDPEQARLCMRSRRISALIYACSLLLYLLGGFFAFLAPLFL